MIGKKKVQSVQGIKNAANVASAPLPPTQTLMPAYAVARCGLQEEAVA